MRKKFKFLFWGLLLALTIYYFYPESQLNPSQRVDKIEIYKKEHTLKLFYHDRAIASYPISISKLGLAPKRICGDNLTPEGTFHLTKRTWSAYHKAIDLGYGCDVLIHGLKYPWIGKFHRWTDWTLGCVALTNDEIDEIYNAVENNCIVTIYP